jgi:hypothetical protein
LPGNLAADHDYSIPGELPCNEPPLCLIAICLLILCGVSPSSAADRAATSALPAALQALGGDNTQIVSQNEADAVRGQRYPFYFVEGWVVVNNSVAQAVVYTQSYQPHVVNIVMYPWAFGVQVRPY